MPIAGDVSWSPWRGWKKPSTTLRRLIKTCRMVLRDLLASSRYGVVATSYEQKPPMLAEMIKRATELAAFGKNWQAKLNIRDGVLPKPGTNLRITPKY